MLCGNMSTMEDVSLLQKIYSKIVKETQYGGEVGLKGDGDRNL